MKKPTLVVATLLAMTASGCQSHPAPVRPLTKLEARFLQPDVVKERILSQLNEVLMTEPYDPPEDPPQNVLEAMRYSTLPYSTETPGLCRYDTVVFTFAPNDVTSSDAQTPTRVRGVEGSSNFRFLSPPGEQHSDGRSPGRIKRDDAACQRLDPNTDRFMAASSAYNAYSAAILLRRLREEAALDQPPFEVVCGLLRDASCIDLLRRIDLDDVASIDSCVATTKERCASLSLHGEIGNPIRVSVFEGYNPQDRIQKRVEVTESIVLWHPRID